MAYIGNNKCGLSYNDVVEKFIDDEFKTYILD